MTFAINPLPLLKVDSLSKSYTVRGVRGDKRNVPAVREITFALEAKKTLGVVGESGSGKSTLGKLLLNLETPDSGEIQFLIEDRFVSSKNLTRKSLVYQIQMIFQDPMGSLNPQQKIWELIAAPLLINSKLSKKECLKEVELMMEQVGLSRISFNACPHTLSGGQRQRVGIARALILKPKIVVCDEPVSALDASVQAQVLNLLMDLQDRLGLTYIFISHDLAVVKHISDQILVMCSGKAVEFGSREQIFSRPNHAYTRSLLGYFC